MEDEREKYCCFLHPKNDYALKALTDECPDCGKPYGFPLFDVPNTIGDFEIVEALNRGFYGAVFSATRGNLKRKSVLKVTPIALYEYFGKDFERECELHAAVSIDTEHLNDIIDYFDHEVDFDGERIPCHVAVLEHVDGTTLSEFLEGQTSGTELAQAAIDLFRLLQELENKSAYHNDIHAKNLMVQSLRPESRRVDAVCENMRLVAVDLGSIQDRSISGPNRPSLGDLNAVAAQLLHFSHLLLSRPDEVSDLDYRLASTLDEIGRANIGESINLRTPDYEDLISQIRDSHQQQVSPWHVPTGLRKMNDKYNAQTLHSWYVSRLLVDPGNEWLDSISTSGPQLITGMRGCGKTMLLKALQAHCRLNLHQEESADPEAVRSAAEQDGYVGLYASAVRLLDGNQAPLFEPYARLLVYYAREALRAVRHLDELVPSTTGGWWRAIGAVIEDSIAGCEDLLKSTASDVSLDHRLHSIYNSLGRNEQTHRLLTSPVTAFSELASAVKSATPVWNSSTVFFLLDDVSTRHLTENAIAELLSTLLFSTENCAFKVTTEAQTFELLQSPGLNEKARIGRDFESFDLSASVNKRLSNGQGMKFIADILNARAEQYGNHPQIAPADLLGSTSLEDIARHIGRTTSTSRERKSVYHGLNALTAMCVGDIGDVLSIYQSMLDGFRAPGPIDSAKQHLSFTEYCSRRTYHLNRREGDLKEFAFGFAAAAHDLLLRSAATMEGSGRDRLRQYAKIYIRITEGDSSSQFRKILSLIDAGVFVLEGGVDVPRAKTRESDPMLQFSLTYRKLFGLTHYIGLADSDRFELSGEHLTEWLENPSRGAEILMRGLGGRLTPAERTKGRKFLETRFAVDKAESAAELPFQGASPTDSADPSQQTDATQSKAPRQTSTTEPTCTSEELTDISAIDFATLVVGMGFEDRTLESARRVLEATSVEETVLVQYEEAGHGLEIQNLAEAQGGTKVVRYEPTLSFVGLLAAGPVIVDITGLAKPSIFLAVRTALQLHRSVHVIYTGATQYYPLEEDIKPVLDDNSDYFEILEAARLLLSGEEEPYSFHRLINGESDPARERLLSAAASPKHERLLSLLDKRDLYDMLQILTPARTTSRARLAQIAAVVASDKADNSRIEEVESDDLGEAVKVLSTSLSGWYRDRGYEIELALSGSKLHAVAAAAVSSALKVSECWYLQPSEFDHERFTKGVGSTSAYHLQLPG